MGRVNSTRYLQLKEIFARFDMDSDGSLTKLELAALLRSLGIKPTGDRIHSILHDMDSNANGSIEFEELAEAIAPVMNERELIDQEQLMQIFQSFDRDGNGFITLPELARSMAKLGQPLTFVELKKMMQGADTDGDGSISFEEFAVVMAKSAVEFLGIPDS
ncbi:putative calcium-binding protein CML16 [Zostera marina]|uniref:Putative calcium-binding protein CML16 n=1 Tax=Zostera marina TaxID=29655 RepID=A0A0K9NU04_ZOSMR|nr:putative calcium-binding protein CML16 [Zostera marina]